MEDINVTVCASSLVMWVKLLCVLAVSDALRIYEGEKHVQNSGEKSADQEGSASVLSARGPPGSPELQHSFGVKIEHPSGDDLHGRVVQQRDHHAFGSQPSVERHEFQPSQTIHDHIGGAWKGISRFTEHQDQQSPVGQDLSQHQLLGQVLQGLGQVNQILGKNHQGIEQVNQIFGQSHKDYKKQHSFPNEDYRETFSSGVDKKQEEQTNLVNVEQEVGFRKIASSVINNPVNKNKDTTTYDLISDFKPIEELNIRNLPKPLETIEVNKEGVKATTVIKEVTVPYAVEVENRMPFKVEVSVERPYPVERPKPNPVYLEKKVPYHVKEYVSQPYTVYKRVQVNKPYTVHVPKPYRVLLEKHVPYPVRVYTDKPYAVHVPVFRPMPYSVNRNVPLPVPVPLPRPYKVYVNKEVPYSAHVPVYRPQEVTPDQGAALQTQTHNLPLQRSEHVPTYRLGQEEVERPRQAGTTDQEGTVELQRYHQHPQWREHVPTYRLGQEEVKGPRQAGTTDQGGTVELQRYHPQWREHVPYPVQVPTSTYHQHEPGQQLVDESGLAVTSSSLEVRRHHQQPHSGNRKRHATLDFRYLTT